MSRMDRFAADIVAPARRVPSSRNRRTNEAKKPGLRNPRSAVLPARINSTISPSRVKASLVPSGDQQSESIATLTIVVSNMTAIAPVHPDGRLLPQEILDPALVTPTGQSDIDEGILVKPAVVESVAADGDQRRLVAWDGLIEFQVVGKGRLSDRAAEARVDHAQGGLHLDETRFHEGAPQVAVVGGHPGHAQAQAGPPPFGQKERQQRRQPTRVGVADG